jgi:hypothetical protein
MPGHLDRLRAKAEMTAHFVLAVINARRAGISLAGAVLLLQETWSESLGNEEICRQLDAVEKGSSDPQAGAG